jgi:hypothetical protein
MNRDRLLNLGIGAMFVGLVIWIATHSYWADVSVPTPLQGEAAQNSYYSVQHLLGELGIQSRLIGSLRALPPNTVVLVNDLHDDLLHERLESLESWVDSGGRLIATGDALWSSGELQTWSGIESSHRDPQASAQESGKSRIGDFNRDEDCAPMTVRGARATEGETLRVCASAGDFSFVSNRVPAWSLSDAQGIAVLRVAVGSGEITALGPRSILRNRTLPLKDHARVFIEAARLQHGDELLILSPSKATPLPVLLWRLAAPALVFFAAAVLLLIWRQLPRFGPPVPAPLPIRRSLAEQIRAHARFAWRTRKLGSLRAAVWRALEETARRHIVGYSALDERERASALAARTGLDAGAMHAILTQSATPDLRVQRSVIALLEASRRTLDQSVAKRKDTQHDR